MGKRKRNGTIYRRGKTWWMAYYANGRRIVQSTGVEDEDEANRQLQVKLGEVAVGKVIIPNRATVGDLCKLVIEDYKVRGLRDLKVTEWRYKKYLEKPLGGLLASRFGAAQAKQYIAMRQQQEAANATINRELAILRRGFKLGTRQEPKLVHEIPTIPELREDNARQGFLEPDEYERLLEELPEGYKAILVCAYHTGARKNELRRIRWEWVDFEGGMIRIPGALTKNKKPRAIPIYGDMRPWLERQRDTCPEENDWVFHGARRLPIGHKQLGEEWRAACKRAKLPGVLFHDMRRSAVRNMKKAGLQDQEAMKISGHLTRNVFDRYNIIDEDDLADAAKRLEAFQQKRKAERAAKLRLVKQGA